MYIRSIVYTLLYIKGVFKVSSDIEILCELLRGGLNAILSGVSGTDNMITQ